MQVIVKGKNIEITGALRKYAEEKIGRVEKHFDHITKAEVELIVEKNPSISNNQTVEATLFTKGPVVRAKESSKDMYASIDMVLNKLERQVEKYKGKTYSSKAQGNSEELYEMMKTSEEKGVTESKNRIVDVRQVALKPMSPEEATLQMDKLGYDFFVFTNSETEEINVVYRRKDKNYSLIEPIV
ncbi:MAG: ribosome-associated translation inhibitor RaiA [Actinobacteria bacterium]|nr:ribosome-associated translation inhibitor RaiA [Actinomycetota bacterium]